MGETAVVILVGVGGLLAVVFAGFFARLHAASLGRVSRRMREDRRVSALIMVRVIGLGMLCASIYTLVKGL